jgi:DNA-binding NarL/FixJ family response regulator
MIASMIGQGRGNREIANELSFSESLVRKETMVIFQYYGIALRQDLKSAMEPEKGIDS